MRDGIRGGGVRVGVGNAPDAATGPGIRATIAATAGLDVLEEHGPQLVTQRLMGAVVTADVEPAATPAAQPLEGVGEPVEAPDHSRKSEELQPVDRRRPEVPGGDVRQVVRRGGEQGRSLVGPAALSAGTPRAAAEFVNQPMVDVAGDQLRDAPPAHGHSSEEGQPAAGDLLAVDLPVVSDQAWEWMEPLLPTSTGRRGGRWRDHRQVVEAICWKHRTGSTWRELPPRFGPWQTAYERLTRWGADGTWARLLARAQTDADASGELDWLLAVDSAVTRVHQHGASARRVGGKPATTLPGDPDDVTAA